MLLLHVAKQASRHTGLQGRECDPPRCCLLAAPQQPRRANRLRHGCLPVNKEQLYLSRPWLLLLLLLLHRVGKAARACWRRAQRD